MTDATNYGSWSHVLFFVHKLGIVKGAVSLNAAARKQHCSGAKGEQRDFATHLFREGPKEFEKRPHDVCKTSRKGTHRCPPPTEQSNSGLGKLLLSEENSSLEGERSETVFDKGHQLSYPPIRRTLLAV